MYKLPSIHIMWCVGARQSTGQGHAHQPTKSYRCGRLWLSHKGYIHSYLMVGDILCKAHRVARKVLGALCTKYLSTSSLLLYTKHSKRRITLTSFLCTYSASSIEFELLAWPPPLSRSDLRGAAYFVIRVFRVFFTYLFAFT